MVIIQDMIQLYISSMMRMMIIIHVLITFPFRMYIHRVLYLAMSPDGQNIVTGAGNHKFEMLLHSHYVYDNDVNFS